MGEVGMVLTLLFSVLIKCISGSTGDRSQMFYTCLQNCLAENCSGNSFSFNFYIYI